jgi:hypothetical protein
MNYETGECILELAAFEELVRDKPIFRSVRD